MTLLVTERRLDIPLKEELQAHQERQMPLSAHEGTLLQMCLGITRSVYRKNA
jgi:hypothetical protein